MNEGRISLLAWSLPPSVSSKFFRLARSSDPFTRQATRCSLRLYLLDWFLTRTLLVLHIAYMPERLFFRELLAEFGYLQLRATTLWMDNMSLITLDTASALWQRYWRNRGANQRCVVSLSRIGQQHSAGRGMDNWYCTETYTAAKDLKRASASGRARTGIEYVEQWSEDHSEHCLARRQSRITTAPCTPMNCPWWRGRVNHRKQYLAARIRVIKKKHWWVSFWRSVWELSGVLSLSGVRSLGYQSMTHTYE